MPDNRVPSARSGSWLPKHQQLLTGSLPLLPHRDTHTSEIESLIVSFDANR
jgi:hypothetical protein